MAELIMTGKTVEEAIESALLQLGLSEEDVTVEVIELPRKKLFKSVPAKVKVSVDSEEPAITKQETAKKAPIAAKAPQPQSKKSETPQKVVKQRTDNLDENYKEIPIKGNEKLEKAVNYIKEVSAHMGVNDMDIKALEGAESIVLKIDGEQVGTLIGHRGETMDSLGYLANLVANKASEEDYIKISLDVNGYRDKRKENLVVLAKRIAQKVLKTGKNHTLEPMNPYERRILHSTVSEIEGVKSESVGEGNTRRVCILPANGFIRNSDRNHGGKPRGRGQGRPQGQGSRGGQKPPYSKQGGAPRNSSTPPRNFADKPRNTGDKPVAQKRTETIKDGENMPLYGKVDI